MKNIGRVNYIRNNRKHCVKFMNRIGNDEYKNYQSSYKG